VTTKFTYFNKLYTVLGVPHPCLSGFAPTTHPSARLVIAGHDAILALAVTSGDGNTLEVETGAL
jgi:hypothetical protein